MTAVAVRRFGELEVVLSHMQTFDGAGVAANAVFNGESFSGSVLLGDREPLVSESGALLTLAPSVAERVSQFLAEVGA